MPLDRRKVERFSFRVKSLDLFGQLNGKEADCHIAIGNSLPAGSQTKICDVLVAACVLHFSRSAGLDENGAVLSSR